MPKREPSLGTDCPIDVDKLVESKLLIQANSGAGKSWAIRRLAEQTYGKAQQIIIDHDGEYYTLREKFDFVLARKGGEAPVDIKSAALLARRLLELNVSAIVDIYELGTQRAEFVKRFLDSLVNAPRDLWHSALIILDEAHLYCPEKGSAVSADAVKNLMALGRKRGFAGVLATQRIAKLSKDAAAETNNKLIGRSALDVDMKRAADELGFSSKEDTRSLRKLQSGQFYAFGPAISDEVRLIKVGPVQTTHLRAGQRTAPPAPPRDRVKKVLAQLADLPHEAEEEAKSVGELRAQVKQLKTELTKAKAAQPTTSKAEPKTEIKFVEKAIVKDGQIKRIEVAIGKGEQLRDKVAVVLANFGMATNSLKAALALASKPIVLPVKMPTKAPKGFVLTHLPPSTPSPRAPKSTNGHGNSNGTYDGAPLPKGEAAMLRAAIQFADGLYKKQLTVLTGYKRSTRDAYILRLRDKGLLNENGDRICATEEGIAAMPNAEPLPTGEALRDFWYGELPSGEKQVLEILVNAYPNTVEKPLIDEATGFKRSTRDAYLLRLGAKELISWSCGSASQPDVVRGRHVMYGPTPVEVLLSTDEVKHATEVGRVRHGVQRSGRRPDGKVTPTSSGEQIDIQGAIAEYALALYLDREWTGALDLDEWRAARTEAGLVAGIRVRSTDWPDGRLLLHKHDPDEVPHILIRTDRCPTIEIVGWALPRDVREPRWWRKGLSRPCFQIPTPLLHSLPALVQLLEASA